MIPPPPPPNKILYEIVEKITCEDNATFFIRFKNSFFSDVKNFKRYLQTNIMITNEQKEELTNIYIQAKKSANILCRFCYKYNSS